MNYSFGRPLNTTQPPRPRIPRGAVDLSLGPAMKGSVNLSPFGKGEAVADWRNELSQWVAAHAYYPDAAARLGEQGDAVAHVVVQPNGRVTSVELTGRSGSFMLDTQLLSMFRNAQLPRLPPSETEPLEMDFTMRYRLIPAP
jgi:periplasmic protein TonB